MSLITIALIVWVAYVWALHEWFLNRTWRRLEEDAMRESQQLQRLMDALDATARTKLIHVD